MSSRPITRIFLPSWILLLLVAAGLVGQDLDRFSFDDVIDVRVVNVEVVVTDGRGQRIEALGPESFRLFVDGIEVPIDYFSEIRDRTARSIDPSSEVASSVRPAQPAGELVGTNYLVFIDEQFSIARDRDRVLDGMRASFAELGPTDRVAITAFNGRELVRLSNWTSSPAQLGTALDEAKSRFCFGLQRLSELRIVDDFHRTRDELTQMMMASLKRQSASLDELGQDAAAEFEDQYQSLLDGGAFGDRPDGATMDYSHLLRQQLERSVLAAVSALRSFRSPSGRSAMLVLAGGWPDSPMQYATADGTQNEDRILGVAMDERSPTAIYRPLTDTANLLGYTLYPVDVPGSRRDIRTVEIGAFATDLLDTGTGSTLGANDPTGPTREERLHGSLEFLAIETGGRALLNSARDRALPEVMADTSSYYWLGFTPQRSQDDRRHEIRVEVDVPGARVRNRAGFLDLSRQSAATMTVEAGLLFDDPGQGPLEVTYGVPRKRRGKLDIPVEVLVPMDQIEMLPIGERWQGRFEVRMSVVDDRGQRSETSVELVEVWGDSLPGEGDFYTYSTTVTVRNRDHRIVVAVHDPLRGNMLASTAQIEP